MSTTLKVTTKRGNGKEVTRNISNVNPNATNNELSSFIVALNGLSNNSVEKIEKVSKSDLEIPELGD